MDTLGSRLQLLIKESGLDQQEISEKINIKRSTLSGYIHDKREPSLEGLMKLADFFHVTVEYLIGHSQHKGIDYPHLSQELKDFVSEKENVEYLQQVVKVKEKSR